MLVRLDLIDPQLLHRGPGVVRQIVHGGGQAEQVLPVNGGDEGAVDVLHQLPADGVRLLFLGFDKVPLFLGGLRAVLAEGLHRVPDHLHLPDQQAVKIETFLPFADLHL